MRPQAHGDTLFSIEDAAWNYGRHVMTREQLDLVDPNVYPSLADLSS
jgi:hypothetical protein